MYNGGDIDEHNESSTALVEKREDMLEKLQEGQKDVACLSPLLKLIATKELDWDKVREFHDAILDCWRRNFTISYSIVSKYCNGLSDVLVSKAEDRYIEFWKDLQPLRTLTEDRTIIEETIDGVFLGGVFNDFAVSCV